MPPAPARRGGSGANMSGLALRRTGRRISTSGPASSLNPPAVTSAANSVLVPRGSSYRPGLSTPPMTVIRFTRCRFIVTVTWGSRKTPPWMAAAEIASSAPSISKPAKATLPINGTSPYPSSPTRTGVVVVARLPKFVTIVTSSTSPRSISSLLTESGVTPITSNSSTFSLGGASSSAGKSATPYSRYPLQPLPSRRHAHRNTPIGKTAEGLRALSAGGAMQRLVSSVNVLVSRSGAHGHQGFSLRILVDNRRGDRPGNNKRPGRGGRESGRRKRRLPSRQPAVGVNRHALDRAGRSRRRVPQPIHAPPCPARRLRHDQAGPCRQVPQDEPPSDVGPRLRNESAVAHEPNTQQRPTAVRRFRRRLNNPSLQTPVRPQDHVRPVTHGWVPVGARCPKRRRAAEHRGNQPPTRPVQNSPEVHDATIPSRSSRRSFFLT